MHAFQFARVKAMCVCNPWHAGDLLLPEGKFRGYGQPVWQANPAGLPGSGPQEGAQLQC